MASESFSRVEAVPCGGCGESLQLVEGVEYLTCTRCKAQLCVMSSDTVVSTQAIGASDLKDLGDLQESEIHELQSRIAQLEQEWSLERSGFLIEKKDGKLVVPTLSGLVPEMLASILLINLPWVERALSSEEPRWGLVHMVLAFLLGVTVHSSWKSLGVVRAYERSFADFRRQRSQFQGRVFELLACQGK